MTKMSVCKRIPILLLLLMFILACNMPIGDLIDTPLQKPTTEEQDLEIQQINTEIDRNFEGFHTYHVKPFAGVNNSTECKPGFEFGDRWTANSIMRFNTEEDWDRSQIKIEAGENHLLTYNIVIKEKPNTFCRLNEQNLVECVYLDTDGYTVRVFNDPPYTNSFQPYVLDAPQTCYAMVHEVYDQDPLLVTEESKFTTFTFPPDTVEISFLGPIPAMPVTSNKTGQYYPKGHDTLWSFEPEDIEDWSIAFLLNKNDEMISGTFFGKALYHEEDPFYVVDGKADISGYIPLSKYSIEQAGGTITTSAPIGMTFSGKVHEPNQFATNGSVIDFLVYHDVDFFITVEGTLKISTTNNETFLMEFEVNDCENSKFSSTNEGAQLSKCFVHLIWNDIPLK